MAKRNHNLRVIRTEEQPAPRSYDDGFSELRGKLLQLVARFQVVSSMLGDLYGLDEEQAAAGMVVQEATEELDALHDQLDKWHVAHVHTPREARS